MPNNKNQNWFDKQPKLTKKIIEERAKNWSKSAESPLSPYELKLARDEAKQPFTREELIEYLKTMYNHAIGYSCLYRMSLEELEAAVVNIYTTWVEECEKEEKILKNPPKSVSTVLASSVCESMKRQSEEIDMKLANSKLDKKNQKEEPEYLKGLTREIILERFGTKSMRSAKTKAAIAIYKDMTPEIFAYNKLIDGKDPVPNLSIKLYHLVDYIKTAIGEGHSILKGITKEKAWDVAYEISKIVYPEEIKKQESKCSCGGDCKCKKETPKQKAKLTLADGREIEVEISEEELKKIEVKKSPYEFNNRNKMMYFINECGVTTEILPVSCSDGYITGLIGNENFYNDEDFAEKCARADLLMRKLRKFAVETRDIEPDPDHCCDSARLYMIQYQEEEGIVWSTEYRNNGWRSNGTIYFSNKEHVKKAIEMFKDELTWYFTEYLKVYE